MTPERLNKIREFLGGDMMPPSIFSVELLAEVDRLRAENKQLRENVMTWMEESFKWNRRSLSERATIEALKSLLRECERIIYREDSAALRVLDKIDEALK